MPTDFASPYAATLGLRRDGEQLILPWHDALLGRPGFLHGGAIAGLLENAAWVTTLAALPGDAAIKPINITIDFLRGGVADTDTHAAAEVVRLGRRIANVVATAWQRDRARPIATARLTLMIERARA